MSDLPGAPPHPPFVQTDLFGGRGDVLVWDALGRQQAPPFTAVLRCQLAPGGSVGAHRQEHFPEIVVGLAGRGEATIDGVTHALSSGVTLHLPLGSILAIRNLSTDDALDYFIIKAAAR